MLLRRKIASITMAVVMTITAAFLVPEITGATNMSDVASQTDAAESEKTESTTETTTENTEQSIGVVSNGLFGSDVPLNTSVGDDGSTVTVYKYGSYNWGQYITATGTEKVWNSSLGYAVQGSLNVSNHGFYIARDGSGNETIAYCLQGSWKGPDSNGVAYPNQDYSSITQTWGEGEDVRRVRGLISASKFLFGGAYADPNSDLYIKGTDASGNTIWNVRNSQDGGTYGTYITTEGVVLGIMVGGKVYPMDENEARAFSGLVAHSITDHTTVTSVTGNITGRNLMPAYEHIMGIANYSYLSKLYSWNETSQIDNLEYVKPYQSFTWEIYNPTTASYETYTSSDSVDLGYADASGNIKLKVTYTSYNMCNNLTTNSSSGNKTVVYNYSAFKVGDKTAHFDYFLLTENSDNTVPFTVSFDKVTASTEAVRAAWNATSITDTTNTIKEYNRDVFSQVAYITVNKSDLAGNNKLSIAVETEEGATATPYQNSSSGAYAIKIFSSSSYQDMSLVSEAKYVSANSSAYLDVVAEGSIKIHKYSANPSMTSGNSCYSLKGATFGVYKTRADALANANAVAVITTDASGDGSATNLSLGTYYVKETKASAGYRVNDTVYTAVIDDEIPVTFNAPETPGNDPAEVIARKKSSEGDIYIEGAVFAIKYYDIQLTADKLVDPATLGETPERTWYIKTYEDGYANLTDTNCVLPESDELYLTLSGRPTIPVGTITIQEIEAPEGYIKDDTVYAFSIIDNPTGIPSVEVINERTIPNSPMKQPFDITKYGETKDGGKELLSGAGFSVCKVDDLQEVSEDYEPAEGEVIVTSDEGKYYIWDSSKAIVLTEDGKTELFTDEKGYAKSIDINYGKYICMETTVPATFLPVDEFTINITQDSREALSFEFTDKLVLTGRIDIHKTGEDRTYNEELGEFENKDIVLEGIKFEIYAAEDLYDVNGSLEYVSGTLVETITTDVNGDASTSDDLPLGKYRVHENVPAGYETVEDIYVTLNRDCDSIRVTDTNDAEKQIVYSVLNIKNKLLIPEIGTTAKDSVSLNNVADPSATTTSIDTISYKNLIPGKEYEINTVLMDKDTQQPLVVDGKEITSTVKFKPESASGQIDVSVTYNSSLLAGKQVVFFEYVYIDEKLVALHAAIDDDGQTITYPPETPPETPPDTPPTGDGAPIGIIVAIMTLACAGLIGMICFKKLPKKAK